MSQQGSSGSIALQSLSSSPSSNVPGSPVTGTGSSPPHTNSSSTISSASPTLSGVPAQTSNPTTPAPGPTSSSTATTSAGSITPSPNSSPSNNPGQPATTLPPNVSPPNNPGQPPATLSPSSSTLREKFSRVCGLINGIFTQILAILFAIWAGWSWWLSVWTAKQQLKQSCMNDRALNLIETAACKVATQTPTTHYMRAKRELHIISTPNFCWQVVLNMALDDPFKDALEPLRSVTWSTVDERWGFREWKSWSNWLCLALCCSPSIVLALGDYARRRSEFNHSDHALLCWPLMLYEKYHRKLLGRRQYQPDKHELLAIGESELRRARRSFLASLKETLVVSFLSGLVTATSLPILIPCIQITFILCEIWSRGWAYIAEGPYARYFWMIYLSGVTVFYIYLISEGSIKEYWSWWLEDHSTTTEKKQSDSHNDSPPDSARSSGTGTGTGTGTVTSSARLRHTFADTERT